MKLKLDASTFFYGRLAVEYQVDLMGSGLSYTKDDKWLYVTSAGFIIGDPENKKRLLHALKTSDKITNLEINGDFAIAVVKQPLYTEPVYNPELIKPKPVFISREGYHIWEYASWTKQPLLDILAFAREHHGAEILKLKQEKLDNLFFAAVFPELTKKQRHAVELAVGEGYYLYPRKTDVHKLAGLMGVSYSTYQEHLRKAEAKLIPASSLRY